MQAAVRDLCGEYSRIFKKPKHILIDPISTDPMQILTGSLFMLHDQINHKRKLLLTSTVVNVLGVRALEKHVNRTLLYVV